MEKTTGRVRAVVRIAATAIALALSGAPLAAKTLVFCSEGAPETLDPQVASTAMGTNAARPVFDSLVNFKAGTAEIVPGLAESWTVSPDGREYVFHLRRGVKFHSRARFTPTRDFDADDVLFSFGRQWRSDHPFHRIADGAFAYFDDLDMAGLLHSIDKVDDWTVRFRLTRAEAPFLTDLAMPFANILSAEYADAMLKAGTPERFYKEPIGTGPFVFEQAVPGVSLRYSAFASYWGGRPPLDALVFSITGNPAVRLTKLKAGECQVTALPTLADAEKISADDKLALLRQDGLNISYLALNASRPPFDDPRVRRAVSMAIDKETLVRAIYDRAGTPIKNPLPRNLWSYNDAIKDYDYDLEAAQRLMSEAGYGQGFATDLWYMPISRPYNPDSRRMAEIIADDLGRIGIKARLVSSEWGDYRRQLQEGVSPMALYGWIGDNGDPDNFLAIILGCHGGQPGPNNIAKWCNPGFDDLIGQGKLTSAQFAREALYRRAQVIVHDEAPILPIAQSAVFMATRRSVHGFHIDPLGRYLFEAVDIDPE